MSQAREATVMRESLLYWAGKMHEAHLRFQQAEHMGQLARAHVAARAFGRWTALKLQAAEQEVTAHDMLARRQHRTIMDVMQAWMGQVLAKKTSRASAYQRGYELDLQRQQTAFEGFVLLLEGGMFLQVGSCS